MTDTSIGPDLQRLLETGLAESIHVRNDLEGQHVTAVPGPLLLGKGQYVVRKKYEIEGFIYHLDEPDKIPGRLPPLSSSFVKAGGSQAQFNSKGRIEVPNTFADSMDLINRFDLMSVTNNGVKNLLPKDSLSTKEISRPFPLFVARATQVARTIGEAKAVSRITTDLSMRISGVSTLEEWWNRSTPEMKWKLLTTRKVSGEAKSGVPNDLTSIQHCECPFQDPHFEMEAFSSEGEESNSPFGGVSFASY